jgi:hypothetical protein
MLRRHPFRRIGSEKLCRDSIRFTMWISPAAQIIMIPSATAHNEPLHVGFTDDKGGINTKVVFDGKEALLHHVWDTGFLNTGKGSAKTSRHG